MSDRGHMVDWSLLQHARGAAVDVAWMLDTLKSDDAARQAEALRAAWSGLYSSDRWYSAQPRFVEELFILAADIRVSCRHKLLSLAANILTQGTGDRVPRGLDFNAPDLQDKYAQGVAGEVYAVFDQWTPFLVSLLRDEESSLRSAAVECLAFVFDAPGEALEPLTYAISRERLHPVLGTMLHGLGLLVRYSGRHEHCAVLERHAAGGPPLVRACAHTGLLAVKPQSYSAEVSDVLLNAMDLGAQPTDLFPFKAGHLDEMFGECVFAAAGRGSLMDLHLATIARGTAPLDTLSRLTNDVLDGALPHRDLATRDDFTKEQLGVLGVLSKHDVPARYHDVGLPEVLRCRRRWLELDSPGPLNWKVPDGHPSRGQVGAGRRPTIWEALVLANDEGELQADLLRANFTPLQVLEIHADWVLMRFERGVGEGTDVRFEVDCGDDLIAQSLDAAGAAALPWAHATTERLLAEPLAVRGLANSSLVPIVRALGAAELLPARYDLAVDLYVWSSSDRVLLGRLQEVLGRIPEARQEAMFAREVAKFGRALVAMAGALPLCPSPKVVALVLKKLDGRLHRGDPWRPADDRGDEVLHAVLEMAQGHAEVSRVIKSYVPESAWLAAALEAAKASLPLS